VDLSRPVLGNKGGARLGGWYPAPGADVYLRLERVASATPAINTSASLLGAPIFSAADSVRGISPAATLSSPNVQNDFFDWDPAAGTINVKIEGCYDIFFKILNENVPSVDQLYLTKNRTAVGGESNNILALEDNDGAANVTANMRIESLNQPLLVTDALRVVFMTSATKAIASSKNSPTTQFHIRWAGVRRS
jgi:hypothetical protein